MARGLNKNQRRIKDARIARENNTTEGMNQETPHTARRRLPIATVINTLRSDLTSPSSSTGCSPVQIQTPDRSGLIAVEELQNVQDENSGDVNMEESNVASNTMDSFIAEQRAFNERVLRLLSNNAQHTNHEQTKAKNQRLPLKRTVSQ